MMKKRYKAFVVSHHLVERIYDIEALATYFEKKLKKHRNNVEIRCNLVDLLYDLDHLKQYLSE